MAKDSPMITAGELYEKVESLGQKILKKKKLSNSTYNHHMLFRRVSRKNILAHPKTISSIFSYQTRLKLIIGLISMIRCLAF